MERYLGENTPKLGFGLMRLPENPDGSYDIEQVKVMVDHFMAAGLTYFDTAYVYGGGKSEEAAKAALVERYPRDSFTLATKLNAWLGEPTEEQCKQQIYTSLERSGAGYFDYYLLHAIQENNWEIYEKYGLWDYVKELKEKGLIRHWGFSFHAGPALLDRLLTEHPDAEFVQLQINYADMDDPQVAARACHEVARRHGKGIVIMEPVKGGALASPMPAVQELLKTANPDASAASWAVRFAASMEGIITVLSGMSNIEQMDDNLSYMQAFQPLSKREQAVIAKAQEIIASVDSIPCTGCRYCVAGCPMNIPIPDIFSARNKELVWGRAEEARLWYDDAIEGAGAAGDCIACGQCEGACPQRINVIERLADCAAAFGR